VFFILNLTVHDIWNRIVLKSEVLMLIIEI